MKKMPCSNGNVEESPLGERMWVRIMSGLVLGLGVVTGRMGLVRLTCSLDGEEGDKCPLTPLILCVIS